MEDHIILSRPSYCLEGYTEAQFIFIYRKQGAGRQIRIEGKLESVWESSESHKLIIFISKGIPRVYDPKTHSLAKIRNPQGSSYRVLGKSLLISGEDQNPMIWIKKSQEYCPLVESSSGYELDSYSIFHDKDGRGLLRIGNISHPLTPESTKLVYPEPKESDAAEIKAETSEVPSISRIKEFPLEALLAKAPKFNYYLAVSPGKKYAIQYSESNSKLTLWMAKNGMMQLGDTLDRHACSLRSACFLGRDDYFASLDSVGTLKIWCLDEDLMSCCQTMHVPEFEHSREHHSICYESGDNYLACLHKEGIDYYSLHLETYKPKKKNQLLSYLCSKEKEPEIKIHQDKTASYQKTPAEKTRNAGNKLSDIIKPKNQEQASNPRGTPTKQSSVAKIKAPRQDKYQNRAPESLGYQLSKTSAERQTGNSRSQSSESSRFIKRSIRVTVGIDFGTSRTKISYRTDTDQTPHIMRFEHLRTNYYDSIYEDWTIPSIVSEQSGEFSFGYQALGKTQGKSYKKLKTSLFKKVISTKEKVVCAAFMAYLFETCKKQIMEEQGISENYEFVYSVCLPVEQMNDNLVVDTMHHVLTLAEEIADKGCYADVTTVMNTEAELKADALLGYSQIIPESAAEIQDYHSRLDDPGYYILFDFGAGTTDMTMFHLATHSKKAEMLGAKIIYKGFLDIEDKLSEVTDRHEIIKTYYQEIFNDFKNSDILRQVARKRKGEESLELFYQMKILVSGGASEEKVIQDIFSLSPLHDDDLSHGKLHIEVLKGPANWPAEIAPYHRCAVAYGLSGDPYELRTKYTLPKDCPIKEKKQKLKTESPEKILEHNRNWTR
jgi:hypothetical protein